MLMAAVKPDISPLTCCTLHTTGTRLRYSSSRFRGLLDEKLARTPTALWYFYAVRRGSPSDLLAIPVVTLLYEGLYGNERCMSRDAVCYNLLCRYAWLVPPCLCWPSRPHAALSAFFTRYIPPRVVVTRVDGPSSPAPLPFSARISMSSFYFQNRWFKRSWCHIVVFIFFRTAILEKTIFSESLYRNMKIWLFIIRSKQFLKAFLMKYSIKNNW